MLRSAAPLKAKRIRMSVEEQSVEVARKDESQRTPRVSQVQTNVVSQINGGTASCTDSQVSTSFVVPKVPGRLAGVELQNFMCHSHLKLNFNVDNRNCYYIVGPNGSGKSALFAGINIALGGKGRSNDRGNSLQAYIKEGETSAKLRVVLTNEGANSLPEYAEQIVVERTINQSGSSYALKSRHREGGLEEVRSRKKSDLDRILNRFSIELDNPLSWLSQDRSRQFLQSMKPEKFYEIFMISSDLEATKQIYEHIASYKDETKTHIEAGEQKKIQLKDEYEKMLMRYKSGVKIEELSRRLSKAQWLLLWAEIRDKAEQIDAENAKLEKLAAKQAEFEDSATSFVARRAALNAEKDGLIHKVDAIKTETMEATARLNQYQAANSRADREVAGARDLIRSKQMELHSIDNEIKQTQQQLNELMGGSNRDLVAEEADLNRQKEEIMNKLDELRNRSKEADANLVDFEATAKDRMKENKNCEFELRELNGEVERIVKDKQLYISAQKNRLNLLGENILKVKQMLHTNRDRFSRPPLGPIGEHIKMRDQKWAKPVEFFLKNILNNFICDSSADRKIFEQLCAQHRLKIPDLVITSYVNEKVNTSANEPSEEFPTVLRAIDVANPTVYNFLIDQLAIENTLLLEKDEDARRIMYHNPPENVRQAFTLNCSHVYPRQDNRPYRFYCNNNAPEARFLAANGVSELARRDFTREQRDVEERIQQQQKLCEEASRIATNAKNDLNSARSHCQMIMRKINDLENSLRQLDEKNQELQKMLSSGTVIENFKATLAENAEVRARIEEQIQQARQHLHDREDERTRITLELREAQDCLKRIDVQSRKIDAQLNDNSAKMEELLNEENIIANKLSKCEQIRKKINDKIAVLLQERAYATDKCTREKDSYLQPDNYTDPPDFEHLPDTETLKNSIKECNQQKAVQQQINNNIIPTIEEVEQLRESGKRQNRKLKEFRTYLKRFSDAVDIRYRKFEILKHNLPCELEREFKEQMLMRNFNGVLNVNHNEKIITLTVDTHKGNREMREDDDENENDDTTDSQRLKRRKFVGNSQQARRNIQDLKGLSGGERSYTTACFVMALWRCVHSPFRCLDEFDVFMDMLNRRVVMEMLVDLAVSHKRNQFFFFTPQGINELQARNNIEIFQLKVLDS